MSISERAIAGIGSTARVFVLARQLLSPRDVDFGACNRGDRINARGCSCSRDSSSARVMSFRSAQPRGIGSTARVFVLARQLLSPRDVDFGACNRGDRINDAGVRAAVSSRDGSSACVMSVSERCNRGDRINRGCSCSRDSSSARVMSFRSAQIAGESGQPRGCSCSRDHPSARAISFSERAIAGIGSTAQAFVLATTPQPARCRFRSVQSRGADQPRRRLCSRDDPSARAMPFSWRAIVGIGSTAQAFVLARQLLSPRDVGFGARNRGDRINWAGVRAPARAGVRSRATAPQPASPSDVDF